MLIDCDSCDVRGVACGDCVVTVLLGAPPDGVHLDPEERVALDVLAAAGMVPPLRLVVAADRPAGLAGQHAAGEPWSDHDGAGDADAPIQYGLLPDGPLPYGLLPYGVAYRQPYGGSARDARGVAADTG